MFLVCLILLLLSVLLLFDLFINVMKDRKRKGFTCGGGVGDKRGTAAAPRGLPGVVLFALHHHRSGNNCKKAGGGGRELIYA